jgi:ABC-type branched-subunit amino acid transport system substrate-binding protein
MTKKTIIAIAVVVIVLIAGYVFTNNQDQDNLAEVKLGVIAGTTGQYAAAGEGYLKGFTLAQEEWNQSHNVKFTAIIEDDGFDAVKGLSAYKKLKDVDKVQAYAILSTFTVDAIYGDVSAALVPVALGFEQSIPATPDNVFQVLPAARPVQQKLGENLKQFGYKKPVAVVSDNTSVYQNFYTGFIEGYGEVQKFDVRGDVALIRAQATKILAAKPDIVVFFAAPKDGALMVKELLNQSGGKMPKLAFDQSIQSGVVDYDAILGESIKKIDGSIVALSRNDLSDKFKQAFKNKYGTEAPFGADMGYNSFMLLANSYNSNKTQWVKNMKQEFDGADGKLTFDENGLRVPNVYFAELQNGEVLVK